MPSQSYPAAVGSPQAGPWVQGTRPVSASAAAARKFHTLDGLRGVAALGVVALHAHPRISSFRPPGAYLAVDLFFLLSGFVLAHAYERRFASGMTAREFLRVRVIRLYPLFLLSVVFSGAFALYELHHGRSPISLRGIGAAIGAGLLMLPTPIIRAKSLLFPLNLPGWSLFLELLVNVFYVLAWRWLSRRVLAWIIGLSGTALAAVALTQGGLDVGPYFQSIALGVPRVMFSFFLGVALRRWEGSTQIASPQPWIAPSLLALLAAIMICPVPELARPWFDLACAVVIFPVMIWLGVKYEPRSELEKRIYHSLGVTSFAIYLLHFPLLGVIHQGFPVLPFNLSAHPLAADAALLGLLWFGAEVIDRCYDVPVRRWLTSIRARA